MEKELNVPEEILINLIDQIPDSAIFIQKLSQVYVKKNKLENAKVLLKRLINKKKVPLEIYQDYAYICVKTAEFIEAEEILKKVIKMDPNNAMAHKDLAVVFLHQKLFDLAEEEFKIALSISPENSLILFEFANYLNAIQDYISAEKLYEKACSIEKDNVQFIKFRAYNLIKLNKLQEAKTLLLEEEESVNILVDDKNNTDWFALYNLGLIYYSLKQFNEAKECLEKSYLISLNQDCLNLLAVTLFELKQYSQAKSYFEKLLEMYPKNSYILLNLSKCAYYLKQYDQAKVFIEKSLNIFPESEEAKKFAKKLLK